MYVCTVVNIAVAVGNSISSTLYNDDYEYNYTVGGDDGHDTCTHTSVRDN